MPMLEIPQDLPKPPSRKGKERDPAVSLVDQMIAAQRRNASQIRSRERTERANIPTASSSRSPTTIQVIARSPQSTSPRKTAQQPAADKKTQPDADDFNRRLKISRSPRPAPAGSSPQLHKSMLFNPNTDTVPMRRPTEPEGNAEINSGAVHTRGNNASVTHAGAGSSTRLFDPRKDDPLQFAVRTRPGPPLPAPKHSADHVSIASSSSYAQSVASSIFTLSSTTDGSSASSAVFDRVTNDEPVNDAFAASLKKLYRSILAMESIVLKDDGMDTEESRIIVKPRGADLTVDDMEQTRWAEIIDNHKRLAEMMHQLLEISLAPNVPASLRHIPTKYNIIIRLWTNGFHKLLEALRRQCTTSSLALEHLQDFIYYAYKFYTGLLEEPALESFKSGWLEALGDLARYRMAVSGHVAKAVHRGSLLTANAVSYAAAAGEKSRADKVKTTSGKSNVSEKFAPRIDDSPSPSIGLAAARLLEVQPEKERWRQIGKEWYAQGLVETPGMGKLHHYLGLLSREKEGEELRGVYHFVKSMITLHPFPTARESVLPLWSAKAQAWRSNPDSPTKPADLFVLLQGMLFTNIQLDDFENTMARFLERLDLEGAEEREWIMMGVVNIAAVLEFGRPSGVLRRQGALGSRDAWGQASGVRLVARRQIDSLNESNDKPMELDQAGQPATSTDATLDSSTENLHRPFRLSLQLMFSMLSYVLHHPTRTASQFTRPSLNSYLTVILTFLSTTLKAQATLEVMQKFIPWEDLASFFATIPRSVMSSQGLFTPNSERWVVITSNCAPPLPEDWCLRGLEWVGRRVFERGYWKNADEKGREIEVLDMEESNQVTDGIIEDGDNDDDSINTPAGMTDHSKRWIRIARCAVGLSQAVEGFNWVEGTRQWNIEGSLLNNVQQWRLDQKAEDESQERRTLRRKWSDDAMDVDDEYAAEEHSSEDDSTNDSDTEDIKALKERRKYLQTLIHSSSLKRPTISHRPNRKSHAIQPALSLVPGYTTLVIDTNIVLSSLSMLAKVIESLQWTVVIPVPVIMELDGLSSNTSTQLADAAQNALAYISSHLRSHGASLKIQTSKGNYLTSLSVRSEQVNFQDSASWERNMDDLILKSAIWQDEHWVDRSALLKQRDDSQDTKNAIKVVLLTLDRNLRLKSRSRQLPAAGEKDLASILAKKT